MLNIEKDFQDVKDASYTIMNDMNDAMEESNGNKELFCELASEKLDELNSEVEGWIERVYEYYK